MIYVVQEPRPAVRVPGRPHGALPRVTVTPPVPPTRIAGAGNQIGLTEAQVLGFSAALSSVGIEAEAGGSAISKVFIDIASQVATSGENLGLLRPAAGPRVPMAQKQGWTTSVRHTAAIVYTRRGPTIAVLLTYRPRLDPSASRALGARLVDLLDRPVGTVR